MGGSSGTVRKEPEDCCELVVETLFSVMCVNH
jgi:hypothetical protein